MTQATDPEPWKRCKSHPAPVLRAGALNSSSLSKEVFVNPYRLSEES